MNFLESLVKKNISIYTQKLSKNQNFQIWIGGLFMKQSSHYASYKYLLSQHYKDLSNKHRRRGPITHLCLIQSSSLSKRNSLLWTTRDEKWWYSCYFLPEDKVLFTCGQSNIPSYKWTGTPKAKYWMKSTVDVVISKTKHHVVIS